LSADVTRLVDEAMRKELANHRNGELVGITCLADGADQLFARAIVDLGGSLEVVIPAMEYRENLPAECWPEYDTLLALAGKVHQLTHVESDSTAHMDASNIMLGLADSLMAVWDGQPARGFGGTADVVNEAQQRGLLVVVVWPAGAVRD
jgi:hypothetical protein